MSLKERLAKRLADEDRVIRSKANAERLPGFSASSAELRRVYTPADVDEESYESRIGLPGSYPYTRGISPSMYRGKLWTMRQYAGFGDADESNRRYRLLLAKGTTGLSVAFDLPTQMGRDSDHDLARGEVGRVGVAIDSIEDMERLFAGIPLDQASTSMTINATAPILLCMYAEVARGRGIGGDKLQGTIQNDVLKEYMARGTYIFPPKPSMRLITDVFAYAEAEWPRFNTISISGYHIREAGSTAAQELAFTIADGIAYVEAALSAGLGIDDFAPRLSFFFNVHNHFLEEVAKFRAARRLWAGLMRDRFGAKSERSLLLRFHSQTAGSTLTAQQPDVNVVRVAIQALAAVLGGTQSLHTNSRDEALALPSTEAATLALRTQQVIAYETGVSDTVDPLGGSYAIEALTDALEAEARRYLDRIEAMGGMVRAIEEGYPQGEIEEASYRTQREIEARRRIVVGVNEFTDATSARPADLLVLDPSIESRQIERLRTFKAGRDQTAVRGSLDRVRAAARSTDNLVVAIRGAVRDRATVGEISDALREVFGEHRPSR